MDTKSPFGLKEVLTHIVGDIADAVSDRPGESQQRKLIRSQAAVHTIMEFRPSCAIEAILAGHCLMFHEMIVDGVHARMRGEEAPASRVTWANIIAMDKAFGDNLTRLERHQHAEASAETHLGTEAEIADRVHRHQSRTSAQKHAESRPYASGSGSIPRNPSPETTQASSEAPDPRRIATSIATDQGDEAWSPAGHTSENPSPGPRAHHSSGAWPGNRQARRHPNRHASATKASATMAG
jgi:hypothetical protein